MLSGPSTHSTMQVYSRIYQSARVIFTNITPVICIYISYTSNFSGKARENAVSRISTGKFSKVWTRGRTPHNAIFFSSSQNLPPPSLSLSGYNTQFFFPPHFLSRTLVADRRACTRVRFSNRWGEDKRDRGWERGLREREREREERGAGSSNLHIYSFTGIQSSLNSAEFVWMRGHRRRMCVATHELHPLFITLRRAWWSSEARTPHGPSPFLSLFLSLSFSVFTFLVFFFSFFKPRSAPLLFSRMRREGLIPRSSETLHLSRGIVQFLTILRVFRRRCRYNLKGGREKLRMDGESNNLHFQCKDDAAG